jgi:general secretion pathway protein A
MFYQPIMDKITATVKTTAAPEIKTDSRAGDVDTQAGNLIAKEAPADQPVTVRASRAEIDSSAVGLAGYLMNMDGRTSRQPALTHAMKLWKADPQLTHFLKDIDDDQTYFRLSAKSSGLYIHRLETDMAFLKKLNLPAILEFYPPGSPSPGYLTLSRIDNDKIVLQGKDDTEWIVAELEELEFYWSGVAYLPWKNFHSIWGTIPAQSYKDSIITLKILLQDIGFENVTINDQYDSFDQHAVETIQAKYGIPVDGYVGPLTKIILYKEKDTFEMPQLSKLK